MAFFEPKALDQDSIFEELKPALMRNWVLLVVLFFTIVISVYGVLLYKSNQYESSALLLVMLGRENSQAPITAENASIFTDGVRAEEINSTVRVLSSHSLIEDAIDSIGVERFYAEPDPPKGLVARAKYAIKKVAKFAKRQVNTTLIYVGLRADLSDREKVIKLMKRSLVVARERDSNVINVSLRMVDPTLARDFVGELVGLYSERHIAVRKNENIRIAFENQTDQYRSQLINLQDRMMEIRKEWNITSIDEQRARMVSELIFVERALAQDMSLLAQLESQEVELILQLTGLKTVRKQSELLERNPIIQMLNDKIARLRVERIEMANRYDAGSIVLELMDTKIKEVESLIGTEDDQVLQTVIYEPNPVYDNISLTIWNLSVEREGVASKIENGKTIIADLNNQIARLNEGANLLEIAELDYSVLKERFKSNAARIEQAKVKQELDEQRISNVTLIAGPTYSEEPVAPRRLLIMAVGTVAAVVLSIALALLKEWVGARIYGRRELESIPGVTFMGRFRIYGQ